MMEFYCEEDYETPRQVARLWARTLEIRNKIVIFINHHNKSDRNAKLIKDKHFYGVNNNLAKEILVDSSPVIVDHDSIWQ